MRLRWIDWTRRAAGCGGTGSKCDPNYLVSEPIGPGNTRGRNVAFIGPRSNPASTSLGEGIGLKSLLERQTVYTTQLDTHRDFLVGLEGRSSVQIFRIGMISQQRDSLVA